MIEFLVLVCFVTFFYNLFYYFYFIFVIFIYFCTNPNSFSAKNFLDDLSSGATPSTSCEGGPPGSSSAAGQKKTCPHCNQQLSWHALSRHVRDMHRNKTGYVTCKFCFKMFRNKNSLGCHMWRFHKDAKDQQGGLGGGQRGETPPTRNEDLGSISLMN